MYKYNFKTEQMISKIIIFKENVDLNGILFSNWTNMYRIFPSNNYVDSGIRNQNKMTHFFPMFFFISREASLLT